MAPYSRDFLLALGFGVGDTSVGTLCENDDLSCPPQGGAIKPAQFLVLMVVLWGPVWAGEIPPLEKIMSDPSWLGTPPSGVLWSPDGERLYFRMRDPNSPLSRKVLYQADLGGGPARLIPEKELGQIPAEGGEWDRKQQRYVYTQWGDLFLYTILSKEGLSKEGLSREGLPSEGPYGVGADGSLCQITRTLRRESAHRFSHDQKRILFSSERQIYAWDVERGSVSQLTDIRAGEDPSQESLADPTTQKGWIREQELQIFEVLRRRKEQREQIRAHEESRHHDPTAPPKSIWLGKKGEIVDLMLSPDERYATLSLEQRASSAERTEVPHFIQESGFVEADSARPKVGAPQSRYHFAVVELESGDVTWIDHEQIPGADSELSLRIHRPHYNLAGTRAFVQIYSGDSHHRWIMELDWKRSELSLIDHQQDSAWVGWAPGIGRFGSPGDAGWLPDDGSSDNAQVWFLSEASGWLHLYRGGREQTPTALTQGPFEVYHPILSRSGKWWYFHSNESDPGERHLYRMAFDGGVREALTTGPRRVYASISPDEKRIALLSSTAHRPAELYLKKLTPGARERRLLASISEEFKDYDWMVPEFVSIPSRDGTRLAARLFRPKGRPEIPGAAVIFVHGAGYLQEAHKGWSGYFREYMFHNLLASRGFTVLDLDFRASAGHGRDFRTAIHEHMGGLDLSDQVVGARWLVEECAVDPMRIGIYGGSYGGFITLMALFRHSDVFAAGAALRPVTDWAHYNHSYTAPILGGSPAENPEAYRRSSPIYFADGLRGRLLICHGMVDDNVHYQDSVRLVQRLIELKKQSWEFASYPVERHSFREPESWLDEYRRIFKLFLEMQRKRRLAI